jgi:hypothetical protein
MVNREVAESPVTQGPTEAIVYTVTVPTGRATMTSLVNTIYDITDPENPVDVSGTKTSGSASASGSVYTTKKFISLVSGNTYRVDCQYTDTNGNIWCPYFRIKCS